MKLLDSGATQHVSGITANAATLCWEYPLNNKRKHQSMNLLPNDTFYILFHVVWWNIAHFKDEIDSMYSEQPLHVRSKTWARQLIFTSFWNKNRYTRLYVYIASGTVWYHFHSILHVSWMKLLVHIVASMSTWWHHFLLRREKEECVTAKNSNS